MTFDVAVIGAGIVGASAAYALARAGARVVALDAGVPGAGTSSNSFAWVNSVNKEPELYHRLNAEGIAAHRRLSRELEGIGYQERGSLEWAARDGESELRERVARLAARGYAASFIPVGRAETLEPGLAFPGYAREIALFAGDGWLDAPRAVARLLAEAARRGAEVRGGARVSGLRTRGDRVEGVTLAGGEIAAGAVLVCVGPATQAFLAPLGAPVPVGRVPGLLAVTSPPASPLGRVVHAPGVHLRPDVSGGLLLGAGDVDDLVTETTPAESQRQIAARLVERVAAVFPPAKGVRLVETRLGVRPMPGDGHTIAGRIPGLANAWMLATHSGITLGPLLGGLIADEIVGGAASEMLAPFRPERFRAA